MCNRRVRPVTDSEHNQHLRNAIDADWCLAVWGEGDIDLMNRVLGRYIKIRDGEIKNPWRPEVPHG